jgi:hypothetical protein
VGLNFSQNERYVKYKKLTSLLLKQELSVAVKREYCEALPREGDIEFVSERPVKRRYIPTQNDEVIDLG